VAASGENLKRGNQADITSAAGKEAQTHKDRAIFSIVLLTFARRSACLFETLEKLCPAFEAMGLNKLPQQISL
jgi:hypothetical protein